MYNTIEKQKEFDKRYYKEHREKILAQKREYYQKNKEKIKFKVMLQWKETMKDPIKKYKLNQRKKKWVLNNIEKHKICAKKWRERNREKLRVYSANRRTLERNAEGSHTLEEWEELLKKSNYSCVFCGVKEKITLDHIIPLNKGGTNYISNIQPLCFPCNASKQDKVVINQSAFSY